MEETRDKTEMQKTKVFNVVNYHGRLADEAFDLIKKEISMN